MFLDLSGCKKELPTPIYMYVLLIPIKRDMTVYSIVRQTRANQVPGVHYRIRGASWKSIRAHSNCWCYFYGTVNFLRDCTTEGSLAGWVSQTSL